MLTLSKCMDSIARIEILLPLGHNSGNHLLYTGTSTRSRAIPNTGHTLQVVEWIDEVEVTSMLPINYNVVEHLQVRLITCVITGITRALN